MSSLLAKPNIVFILADDCLFRSIGCYGGVNVETPNIDRLAQEGIQFNRAYASTAMCVPFRHELHTGLYPMRNASVWNHSATRPGLPSTASILKDLGYRVGLTGKRHLYPSWNYPFEGVPGFEHNCVAKVEYYQPEEILPFLTRDRDQPFVLSVNSTLPHRPWTMGDASQFDPDKLVLPPSLPDTQVIREEYTHYLAEVKELDRQVGDVMKMLEDERLADNTLVMFCSEQGWQFMGGKWNAWDISLHTALVARWPGKIPSGTKSDALVQICDVLPTLIEVAGGNPIDYTFDGRSFLPVMTGESETHRGVVFGMHNNVPEGPPYPMRTALDDDNFRIILNLEPDGEYIVKYVNGELISAWFGSVVEAAEGGDDQAEFLLERLVHRPAVELYDVANDPFELKNLAEDPQYAERRERLENQLSNWMAMQGDPGAEIDRMEVLEENRVSCGFRK